MRILIVEDEVRLAETLRDLLELEHYTTTARADWTTPSPTFTIW